MLDFLSHLLLVYASIESIQQLNNYSNALVVERRKERDKDRDRVSPIWRLRIPSEENARERRKERIRIDDGKTRKETEVSNEIHDKEERTEKKDETKGIKMGRNSSCHPVACHFRAYNNWHRFWGTYFGLKTLEILFFLRLWCPNTYSFLRFCSLFCLIFPPSFFSSPSASSSSPTSTSAIFWIIYPLSIESLSQFFTCFLPLANGQDQKEHVEKDHDCRNSTKNTDGKVCKEEISSPNTDSATLSYPFLAQFCESFESLMDRFTFTFYQYILQYFHLALFYLLKFSITIYQQNEDFLKATIPGSVRALIDLTISQIMASNWFASFDSSSEEAKSKLTSTKSRLKSEFAKSQEKVNK